MPGGTLIWRRRLVVSVGGGFETIAQLAPTGAEALWSVKPIEFAGQEISTFVPERWISKCGSRETKIPWVHEAATRVSPSAELATDAQCVTGAMDRVQLMP